MMYSIALLGPIEIRRDGEVVSLPGGKTTELLVRLALDAGVMVRAEQLIEDLWGESGGIEKNTLHSKVSMLRRALGDAAVVTGGRNGYTLNVDPSAVDAIDILRVASIAKEGSARGDHRAAVDGCRRALEMFRGDILCDAGDGDWVIPHRVHLEEVRLGLFHDLLAARLELGDAPEAIGELETLVARHPLRESLWVLLITALYRSNRQADALAAYKRIRMHLADELGLDPGPRLQQLEQQILAHDEVLRRADPMPTDEVTTNLPALSAALVGRADDVATIQSLVARERLVTVVGPGGVGKTALAIETGRQLSASGAFTVGGVWLVRLETATTASAVVDAVIGAVGVPGGERALFDRLRSSETLLVMDNCEHVVDSVADLAVRLLDACPALHLLATSQVALDIDGETAVELAPLPLADAVELFGQRISTHGRHRSGDDPLQVEDLCRSLDGLPLAIELAAARTKTLSVSDIVRRLDDRFNVLSDPASRRPERRRALRSTIAWSYDLLFPDDQKGLWALSTFAGGAPLDATEQVLHSLGVPASATIDVVGRLASRSLLIADDDAATGSVRYRLLDSIRAFARDAMADAGNEADALDSHARWIAEAAAVSTDGVRSHAQGEYLAFARRERANIDAALAWSGANDPGRALEIAVGFGWAWIVLGDSRGAERLLAALEAVDGRASPRDEATALLFTGWIQASLGNLDSAHDHIARAQALADRADDVELQARALYYLAYVVSHGGRWADALDLTERSAALYDTIDRPWDQASIALFAARAANSAGDVARASSACATVRHWLRALDDPWLHVRGEAVLGELARIEHRFDDAVAHLTRAARTSATRGFRQTEAYQLSSLGRAQCQAGDYHTGADTLELALTKAEATGDPRLAALIRVHLGRVLRGLGRPGDARIALDAAAAFHRAAGGGEQAALGDCLLAALDAADAIPDARERLAVLLDNARADNDAPVEVFALDALARVAFAAGDAATAHELTSAADLRMADAAHFITEQDRVDVPARNPNGPHPWGGVDPRSDRSPR